MFVWSWCGTLLNGNNDTKQEYWEEVMNYSDLIIYIMEIIGTVAFAVSGAMTAIQKRMDLFGVNVLGVTTAVGGGLIRDLILGANPPVMFCDASYALTAMAASTLVFLFVYFKNRGASAQHALLRFLSQPLKLGNAAHEAYDHLLLFGDTIGLGIFTVVGSYNAVRAGYGDSHFLIIFVGVLTGVGGGMLRDIMAGNLPYILVKHVYAVASLAGAFAYTFLFPYLGRLKSMVIGAVIVMVIRVLAAKFKWNLPRI